jgi:hypothetical protein
MAAIKAAELFGSGFQIATLMVLQRKYEAAVSQDIIGAQLQRFSICLDRLFELAVIF